MLGSIVEENKGNVTFNKNTKNMDKWGTRK